MSLKSKDVIELLEMEFFSSALNHDKNEYFRIDENILGFVLLNTKTGETGNAFITVNACKKPNGDPFLEYTIDVIEDANAEETPISISITTDSFCDIFYYLHSFCLGVINEAVDELGCLSLVDVD